MAEKKNGAEDVDSDDDFGDVDGVKRTKEIGNGDSAVTRDENEEKIVDKTSGADKLNEIGGKGNDLNVVVNGSSLNSGQIDKGIHGSNAITGDKNDLNKGSSKESVRFEEKCDTSGSVNECENGVKGESERKNGDKCEDGKGDKKGCENGSGKSEAEKDVSKSDVETELSWKEVNRDSPYNAHKTQCAFEFSNAVMFDLDID